MFFVHGFRGVFKQAACDEDCSLLCIAIVFHSYFMFFVCCFRDVFKQATCDEGCSLLADQLGWAVSCLLNIFFSF